MVGLGFLRSIISFAAQKAGVSKLVAGHPLAGMVREGMGHFMAQYGGDLVIVLGDCQNAGVNDHFATGKAKGVDLPVPDAIYLPLEAVATHAQVDLALQRFDPEGPNKFAYDIAHAASLGIIGRQNFAPIFGLVVLPKSL